MYLQFKLLKPISIMYNHFYLIKLQYLGFRFHGWAKQPKLKTVHEMVDKTVSFVLKGQTYKTLGSSRTDAMVSANEYSLELFTTEPVGDDFLEIFNSNLPPDIRALSIQETDGDFNIIQNPKQKEYVYLFSHGTKNHPFSAPFMATFSEGLDIEKMKEGARLFEGEHDFINYCTQPSKNTKHIRTIDKSEIVENTLYTANFFPEESFIYRVISNGFMRNQVRLMVGQLIEAGRGNVSIEALKESIITPRETPFRYIAPASGLILHSVSFK